METDLIHFSTRLTVITSSGQTRSIKRIAWLVAVVVFVLISTFQTKYYASYAGKKQIWNLNKYCRYTVVLNMAQTVTLVSLGSMFIKISQTGDKLIFSMLNCSLRWRNLQLDPSSNIRHLQQTLRQFSFKKWKLI